MSKGTAVGAFIAVTALSGYALVQGIKSAYNPEPVDNGLFSGDHYTTTTLRDNYESIENTHIIDTYNWSSEGVETVERTHPGREWKNKGPKPVYTEHKSVYKTLDNNN